MLKNIMGHLLFFILAFLQSQTYSEEYIWENRVYLASFPRSGNHWVRYLLEEVTGIATSSVYPDPEHRVLLDEVFPWGGYCSDHGYEGNRRYPEGSDFVIVKTHYPYLNSKFDGLPCKLVIRLIRHPIDSFYSLYKYSKCKREFKEVLPEYIHHWKQFQEYWDGESNVYNVRYEDLYANPFIALMDLVKKIGLPFDFPQFMSAIYRYRPSGGLLRHLDSYDDDDLRLVYTELQDLLKKYNYRIPGYD